MRKGGLSRSLAAGRAALPLLAAILCGCRLPVPVAYGFVTNSDASATPRRVQTSLGMSLVMDRHDTYNPYSTSRDWGSSRDYGRYSDYNRNDYNRYDTYSSSGGDSYAMDLYRRYDDGDRYYRRDFPASSTLRLQAARDAFYAGLYKDTGRDRYWRDSLSLGRSYLALPTSRDRNFYSDYGGGYGRNSYDRYNSGGYGSHDRYISGGYGGSYDRHNSGRYSSSSDRYDAGEYVGSYDRYNSRNDYYRPSSYFSADRRDYRDGNSNYGYSSGSDRYRSSPYDIGSGYRRSWNYDRQDYRYGNGRDYRSSSYDGNKYNVGYGERKSDFYSSRPSYTPSPYDSTTPYDRSNYDGRRGGDWLNTRADDERHWSSEKPLRRNPYYLSSGAGYGGSSSNRYDNNYEYSRDNRYDTSNNYRSSSGDRYDNNHRRGDSYSQSHYTSYQPYFTSESQYRGGRASVSREEEENFEYVNRERRKHGLQELLWSEDLAREAQRWSQHLADAGELYHRKPLSQNIDAGWLSVTENVAYNPSAGPEGAHASFMQSPGHRKNILDPNVNRLGIGVTKVWYPGSEKYRAGDLYYVVQIFKQV